MRPRLALMLVALGLSVACLASQTHSVQVSRASTPRLHVGDRVQVPTGTVGSILPSGLVRVHIRIRESGDLALDVVTLECDPLLLKIVK